MYALRPRLSAARGKVLSISRHLKGRLVGGARQGDHRISAAQWDAEFAGGDWDRLGGIAEVSHYAVILGYLDYGASRPTVLDVGCGYGRLTCLLARFGFAHYLGVDISVEAVRRAEALSIPDARFEVGDMNHWDTAEKFDVVVLNESLYYSDDPLAMFERAVGWLDENGVVIVSMFKPAPGAARIWSQIESRPVTSLASSTVIDHSTGNAWDIKALRRSR